MAQSFPIIETKLIPPMPKKNYIRRPGLMKKLRSAASFPLTIVHSGAGFGKSTALSLYINDFKTECCWYTITPNDDDIIPFISYVVASVRKRFLEFGQEIDAFIQTMNKIVLDQEMNILCALFIKELSSIKSDVTIVLDDFHLVDHSFSINHWLEKVIEHIPENVHFIVSSRKKPKWNLLTKWKVSGKLLEIDKELLTLDIEEIDILFEDFHGISLTEEQLHAIFQLTEGWVIAISMIAEQLTKGTGLEAILSYNHSSMEDLFHYLASEVFTKHTPIIQSFIEQVSCLEEMTPALCDNILGIQGSEAILEQLVEQNAFIYKLDGSKQYRFHALFKAAIEKRLKEQQNELYQLLNEKCAQYFLQLNLWEHSIVHYEKINHYEEVAAILEKYGTMIMTSGKLESFLERLKKIPAALKDKYKMLWFYEGEVYRYLAFYEKAKNAYEHIIDISKQSEDWALMSKAYEGIAQIYIDTIQPVVAQRYLHLAIDVAEKHFDKKHPDVQRLYGLMAENLVNAGQAKTAEKWIKKGALSAETLAINNLDARMYLRTGKLEKAKEVLESRIETSNRGLPQTHRETEILLSFIETCLGNGQEAKQLAQKGIEQGMKYKNFFVEACGWMRIGHSAQILQHYDTKLAEQCYLTSLDIMEKIHVPRGKAEPFMGLCLLYSKNGEYELSKKYGQNALYETEKVQDIWLSSFIRLSIGIAAYNCEHYDEAKTYFLEALTSFRQCEDQYGYMLCQLWLSFIYYLEENWLEFQNNMTIFLQEVQVGNYQFIFFKHTPYGPRDLQSFIPLLLKVKELNPSISFVQSILQQVGYDDVESHPGYTLKVQTFGNFKVFLGDQLVTDKDWHRIKAKELFQYLLINKNRWCTKEEIYEQIWPNVNEKMMEQEFKVIFNSCNKALEPKRKARSSPFYIERQNNSYRINPKAVIELDFEQFEFWVQEGLRETNPEKAISLINKGIIHYKDDFLVSKQDNIRINMQRDHYRTLFLRGAEKLAQAYVQMNDIDQAIYWCERIISIDHTWEEAYRLLMYCHYLKNNRTLAIKYYNQCCSVLKNEFGVKPMETTMQMYNMIIGVNTN